jgi:hypothetical protein
LTLAAVCTITCGTPTVLPMSAIVPEPTVTKRAGRDAAVRTAAMVVSSA